jgi:hypothetical protein
MLIERRAKAFARRLLVINYQQCRSHVPVGHKWQWASRSIEQRPGIKQWAICAVPALPVGLLISSLVSLHCEADQRSGAVIDRFRFCQPLCGGLNPGQKLQPNLSSPGDSGCLFHGGLARNGGDVHAKPFAGNRMRQLFITRNIGSVFRQPAPADMPVAKGNGAIKRLQSQLWEHRRTAK